MLWLLFGIFGEDGVALHKKHHAYADRNGDQLSPKIHGKYNMLVKKPLQRISLKLTQPTHYGFGGMVFFAMNAVLFGVHGIFLYLVFVIVSVVSQQVILDGAGHLIGYRNYFTKDNSKNIFPIGIIFAGEELHNNHHADPSSAKYSKRWFEFDIGFFYIKILEFLRLAEIHRI